MALSDLPNSGSANFESICPSILHNWRDNIDRKSSYTHIHSGTSVYYFMIFADTASITNAGVTGALSTRQDNINKLYKYNYSNTEWTNAVGDVASIIQAEVFN